MFYKDYSEVKQISVSLKKFEEAFQGTRFEGVCLEGVMEAYFGMPLISNKEREVLRLNEVEFFFDNLSKISSHDGIKKWLLEVKNIPTSASYQWLLAKHEEGFISVNTLINLTETSKKPLIRQVAAVQITKNTHALDDKMPLWRILMYYLMYETGLPFPRQSDLEVFYHGDHDPEGLRIADKLKTRFSNVKLYGYDLDLNMSSLSEETISIKRLKQLEKIESKELTPLANEMKKVGKAAYEEAMMDMLFSSHINIVE